jgi:hypothetical protein
MENPTDQAEAEASIATDTAQVNSGPSRNRTVAVRRKAAKRTHPFDLAAEELHLVPSLSLSSPQAEGIPAARKKPRLDEPLPVATDEAARKTAPPGVSVGLPPPPPPPAADNDDANANADHVTVTRRSWTLEEDAKLTSAVTNTSQKKCSKEYKTNWAAIAALVPSRTSSQCRKRWKYALDPTIDRVSGRTGKWSEDEDKNLKDAVQTHGGKNWETIAALVPGRTKIQCSSRWCNILAINIDPMKARAGKWTADENIKLKDAVQTHGGKDWAAIAALVPGRTKMQCRDRWKGALDSNIDPTTARVGKWSEDEDKKLKGAVPTHGGKNWKEIAALVPGRTKSQCRKRWHNVLKPSIDLASGHTGK